ncbi:hypothetical protein RclHR1_01580022 [Rhizophagus clarus]|uniref:Uncharacterized protein n=1 Tax=Rhizophagus clarus TaxID=94130 RepID=A0A2Z6QWK8_9GLOM|nr:hypothetical protein RclHR1_01580022 [Rhizophagus clarus]
MDVFKTQSLCKRLLGIKLKFGKNSAYPSWIGRDVITIHLGVCLLIAHLRPRWYAQRQLRFFPYFLFAMICDNEINFFYLHRVAFGASTSDERNNLMSNK